MFEKLSHKNLGMEIVEQITKSIRNGTIKEGSYLPSERELAEQFGVARPTVREALKVLAVGGLISIKPGLGAVVRPIKSADNQLMWSLLTDECSPLELLQARMLLEITVSVMAAEERTIDDLKDIRSILDCMEREVEEGRFSMELDASFHSRIAASCSNSVLAGLARSVIGMTKQKLYRVLVDLNNEQPLKRLRYVKEHEEIYEALERQDLYGAAATVRKHITGIMADVYEEDVVDMLPRTLRCCLDAMSKGLAPEWSTASAGSCATDR